MQPYDKQLFVSKILCETEGFFTMTTNMNLEGGVVNTVVKMLITSVTTPHLLNLPMSHKPLSQRGR